MASTSRPSRRATSIQFFANSPMSNPSTRSPGESVLTSDASQAPLPDAGKITTGPDVWNTRLTPFSTV